MYRIGRHHHAKFRRTVWAGILTVVFVLLGSGAYFVYRILTVEQVQATLPAAVVHEFAPPETTDRLFDEDYFSIKLPEDWQLKSHSTESIYNKFTYQATQQHKDNRWLEVYVDRVPEGMSYNRILPVYVHDNRIVVSSSVSDNCTTFVTQKLEHPSAIAMIPIKWQGVAFNCDVANYIRNVVGVGSPERGHKLLLTGASGIQRTFYFVYIDHNINPDYQILERALESFIPK